MTGQEPLLHTLAEALDALSYAAGVAGGTDAARIGAALVCAWAAYTVLAARLDDAAARFVVVGGVWSAALALGVGAFPAVCLAAAVLGARAVRHELGGTAHDWAAPEVPAWSATRAR